MKASPSPLASCNGKQRFADRASASKVVNRTNRSRDRRMNAYRCAHCEGWHVGQHLRKPLKKERDQ